MTDDITADEEGWFRRQQETAAAIVLFLAEKDIEPHAAVLVAAMATGACIARMHPDNRATSEAGAIKVLRASRAAQERVVDAYARAGDAGLSPEAGRA